MGKERDRRCKHEGCGQRVVPEKGCRYGETLEKRGRECRKELGACEAGVTEMEG